MCNFRVQLLESQCWFLLQRGEWDGFPRLHSQAIIANEKRPFYFHDLLASLAGERFL
jgi:hypothetical protein